MRRVYAEDGAPVPKAVPLAQRVEFKFVCQLRAAMYEYSSSSMIETGTVRLCARTLELSLLLLKFILSFFLISRLLEPLRYRENRNHHTLSLESLRISSRARPGEMKSRGLPL